MGAVRAGKNLQIRARPLFVDGHVIAISKPSGVVSQMHGRRNDCIHDSHHDAKALEPILDDLVTKFGLNSKPIPVHRLDKNTTGVLLLARTPHGARDLSQQLSSRMVHKTYLALVRAGKETFEKASGQIREKIRYIDGRPRIDQNGILALTSWSLIDTSAIAPVSLLKLTLHTGLKHQLRVHLSHVLKAPILGDTLHSTSKPSAKITAVIDVPDDRLFLHASQVSFTRYRKATPKKYIVEVFAPLPKDFQAVCRKLRLKLNPREVHGGVLINGENAPWNLIDFETWWMNRSPASSRNQSPTQHENIGQH